MTDWVDISDTAYDGMKRWKWECRWCGKTEYSSCMASGWKPEDDYYPWNIDSCYHCHKDRDGNIYWSIYRQGDCGYYGDGDFQWNGTWKGEKLIRACNPMDDVRANSPLYGYDRPSNYGLPVISLTVTIHSKTFGNSRRRRPSSWFARLSIQGEWHWRVDVVTNKKCRSIKQVKDEVDKLDLTDHIAELCKQFYDRNHVDCVWIKEDGQWQPLMSNFTDSSDFDWPNPHGYSPRYYCSTVVGFSKDPKKHVTNVKQHTVCGWSSSGGTWDETKYGKKPVPWIIRSNSVLSEDIDVRQQEPGFVEQSAAIGG